MKVIGAHMRQLCQILCRQGLSVIVIDMLNHFIELFHGKVEFTTMGKQGARQELLLTILL